MQLIKRALFRATVAGIVTVCLTVALIGFTQPWMIWGMF